MLWKSYIKAIFLHLSIDTIVTDTAYTKRPSSNGQEEWYIFDDTSVGKIDEKEVEKEVVVSEYEDI